MYIFTYETKKAYAKIKNGFVGGGSFGKKIIKNQNAVIINFVLIL